MDKLMNAAGAATNQRREVKFELQNPHVSVISQEVLTGLLEPIGFTGYEIELLKDDRAGRVWPGDIASNMVGFIMKYIDVLFNKFSLIEFTEHYTKNSGEHYTKVIIELDDKHTRPCEVGDYSDTTREGFVKMDHDVLTITKDKYALIKRNKTAKNKSDWACLDKVIEVCIIRWKDDPYAGLSVIPKEVDILGDITYKDVTIKRSIKFNKDNVSMFKVAGKVVVDTEVPIECSGGIVNIKGEQGSKLILISADQQPCIGSRTHTGMSYGRWSPEGSAPKEIIVDGCEVTCINKVPAFSIGSYGDNEIPKVTCINGGVLICPEMTGERIVLKMAQAPDGSTKILEDMVYAIKRQGDSVLDLISPEVKNAYADLVRAYPKYTDVIAPTTSFADLKEAKSILGLNIKVDVTLLIMSTAKLYKKRGALLLRLPEMEEVSKCDEFRFEMRKWEFLRNFVFHNETVGQTAAIVNLIQLYKEIATKERFWDFMKEVCYELIPAYDYDFQDNRDFTNEEHVNKYLENNSSLISEDVRGMIDPQTIFYFLWDNSVIDWDERKK